MITAADSNVLFDIITASPRFGARSRAAFDQARLDGTIVVSEVVWAEVTAGFNDLATGARALEMLGAEYLPMAHESAALAGQMWRRYRQAGGSRERLLPDFLIGAHAQHHADRLLTRDRGFYRPYFSDLVLLDPTV
jgi:hypothetical protein